MAEMLHREGSRGKAVVDFVRQTNVLADLVLEGLDDLFGRFDLSPGLVATEPELTLDGTYNRWTET